MAFMPQGSYNVGQDGVMPPPKFGRWKASRMVVEESWAILKRDKEILWFPILSGITMTLASVIMSALYFFAVLGGDVARLETIVEETNYISFVFLFASYLVSFLIVNFFQAGVMLIAHARMRGEDLGFRDGVSGASRRLGKIFVWSLISATAGIILDQISQRSQVLGKIVAAILGAAWTILTYFSLPSLIIDNVSVVDSFKQSASMIRKTWGETIIVNVGVSLYFALLMLGGMAVFLVTAAFFGVSIISLILFVLLVVYLIALMVVASALSSIFKTALYEYTKTGQVPAGFSPELIKSAISRR